MQDERDIVRAIVKVALTFDSPESRASYLATVCQDDAAMLEKVERLLAAYCTTMSVQPPSTGNDDDPPTRGSDTINRGNDDFPAVMFDVDSDCLVEEVAARESDTASPGTRARIVLRDSDSGLKKDDAPLAPLSQDLRSESAGGRYELQGEIARGGMGAILKGRDAELGRDVAIKVLHAEHQHRPEVVERFIGEAQIGGQLQHPGIAPVYELGRFDDRRPFFAMKLVKGKALAALLAERETPQSDRARFVGVFEHVCQTLAYAHARGVVHRDLKPGNVMVGAFGEVQVVDWGLAKILPTRGGGGERPEASESQVAIEQQPGSDARRNRGEAPLVSEIDDGSQTRVGSVMGTPAYMSPEQALGDVESLDERADVFGLGAILCEILTGRPPYSAKDGIEAHCMAASGDLADCFARLDASGADAELIVLTKDCLARKPSARPRDARVLAERVSGYRASVEARLLQAEVQRAAEAARAEGALQTAREQAAAARAERHARRMQLGLAAVVSAVLLIGGIAASWTASTQMKLKNAALRSEEVANSARHLEFQHRKRAEQQQGFAEMERTRAEREESRAKAALTRAEAEAIRSLNMLADMQVERGVQAAREGHSATAALWFANAAGLTPHDPERHAANLRRAITWERETMAPVAVLRVDASVADRVEFQPLNGDGIFAVCNRRLHVWNWRRQQERPWCKSLDEVVDADWSPDGRLLAVAFAGGNIQVLEPTSGERLHDFRPGGNKQVLRWSPDGKRLAIAGERLELWNVSDQAEREAAWTPTAKIYGVRFSRAGDRLVAATDDNKAQVFAVPDRTQSLPLFTPVDHAPYQFRADAIPVFLDDDRVLVTVAAETRSPVFRSAANGTLLSGAALTRGNLVRSLDVSSDGRKAVVAGSSDFLLMTIEGGKSNSQSHGSQLHHAIISTDGRTAATFGYDGFARISQFDELRHSVGDVSAVIPMLNSLGRGAFSSDGAALAISIDRQLVVWERRKHAPVVGRVEWQDGNWRPRPSFDGRFIAPGAYHEYYSGLTPKRPQLSVARMSDGSPAGPVIELAGPLFDSCVCADNESVAAVGIDRDQGWLACFDIATGQPRWPTLRLSAPPLSVAARPATHQVAVLSHDGRLQVVDSSAGEVVWSESHDGVGGGASHARVAYSPDGATLVVVLQDSRIAIRDAQTGTLRSPVFSPLVEGGLCRSIAFSPDSRFLATAVTGKNQAQVWSLEKGEKVGVAMSHPGDDFGLWSITFSPDGARIATGHKDGRVRFFDWRTGEVAGMPLQHADEVNDIAFTSDGRHLLTCMRLGTLHAWDVATGKLAAPLRPELKLHGGGTQSLGIAGDRVVVCGQSIYPVVDLTVLLPEIRDETSSVLRRIELATNQKLQFGELVPLELAEWNERWEQLAGTRAQGAAAASDAPAPATSPPNVVKQPIAGAVAQAKAAGRGLLERLQALRPKTQIPSSGGTLPAGAVQGAEATAHGAEFARAAALGRWKEAAAAAMREIATEPDNRLPWMRAAAATVLADDRDEYRKLNGRMLTQFLTLDPQGQTLTNAERADSLLKSTLLLPDCVDRAALPVSMLVDAVARDEISAGHKQWFYGTLALAAYRDGDFQQAETLSAKSLELSSRQNSSGALALLVLAMANWRLQKPDAALAILSEATDLVPAELETLGVEKPPRASGVAPNIVFHDWLIAEILRREAALLIRKSAARALNGR